MMMARTHHKIAVHLPRGVLLFSQSSIAAAISDTAALLKASAMIPS
jgi:hypothetical protein